ncbi:MAG: polyphenol oxidase family protein, partial [Methylobacter sp.]
MSGIKHWLAPDWPAPANIYAATTLRTGGVSGGAYASLNPAMHVGDDADLVKQNRQHIKALLSLPSDPIWLDQIHSNRAVPAIPTETLQQADASYTAEPDVVCAVLTADCLPLLICTTDGSQVAAIHAGWRGLLAGVIGNTLTAMKIPLNPPFTKGEVSGEPTNIEPNPLLCKMGARGNFLVWLGPAIGPECFEIGPEVRDAFLEKSAAFTAAFKQQSNGKWLADIYQ